MPELDERNLLEQGIERLRGILGEGWKVGPLQPGTASPDRGIDTIWRVGRPGSSSPQGEILVEAKSSLTPVVAATVLGAQVELMRQARGTDAVVLVIAPWLSPRTRTVLDERGFSYLDLTGNVSIRLNDPTVLIRTEGDQRDPRPRPRGRRGLSGPRAGRLARELADFREPRRAKELAEATGISESYISRLLDSMSDEGLIRRKGHVITRIDWRGLLRSRAASYQLMKANHVSPAIARLGRDRTLDALRHDRTRHQVLATGSLAAQGFAPTAIGGAFMLYVPPGPHVVEEVAQDLGLLRVDQMAVDVLLLQPMSHGAMHRPHPERLGGIECVGLSQLVLDCLSGPGRMPAEGEAVLGWMGEHEGTWRRPSPLQDHGTALC